MYIQKHLSSYLMKWTRAHKILVSIALSSNKGPGESTHVSVDVYIQKKIDVDEDLLYAYTKYGM